MKLACIFKHKWEYETETCSFHPPKIVVSQTMFGTGYYSGPLDSKGNPIPINYDRDVRTCKRCKKKERKDMKFKLTGRKPSGAEWVTSWVDCELTQEDIKQNQRDKLIEEILVELK
jgi:hypothetical protein